LKSPLKSAANFLISSNTKVKAYFPESLVGVSTKQVYLGAPIIKTFTSYCYFLAASTPP